VRESHIGEAWYYFKPLFHGFRGPPIAYILIHWGLWNYFDL
jgi:hypothetical protein